ncbi:helix-turn-helix transcriptional regulator [Zophobihabitans entericus]|uniref:AlpA family phage regulatory protein n=1 Tax=Zophobihabitans entericus TaxID=1635327 RepID=A0A6G9IB01_9GAMM|nr:AlpA family phage regulatory protein [Zophobihabitans entericus]QIQ20999.1 AlpA family phage regulatory protein [Zophobihabitans entericus]
MKPHLNVPLIRLPDVLHLIPISKATWYSWIKQGIAPKPICLSARCVAWKLTDIQNFIEEKQCRENGHV